MSWRVGCQGVEIFKLGVASESRTMNGRRLESSSLRSSKPTTKPDTEIDDSDIGDICDTPVPGSVLDYFIASEELISALAEMAVHPIHRFSDHCPVSLSWIKSCKNIDAPATDKVMQSSPLVGWSIRGISSNKRDFFIECAARYMREHPNRFRVRSLIDKCNPSIAYRFLRSIIRDGREHAGASVRISDGSSGGSFRAPLLPVKSWFDDEAREAHKAWKRLRFQVKRAKRRNYLSFELKASSVFARSVVCTVVSNEKKRCSLKRNRNDFGKKCDAIMSPFGWLALSRFSVSPGTIFRGKRADPTS